MSPHAGGRPASEDRLYSREVGISVRKVRLMGGAAKLRALPEESRNLLLKRLAKVPRDKGWGLEARGMTVKKLHEVNEKFEAHVHALLVERGLVKDA